VIEIKAGELNREVHNLELKRLMCRSLRRFTGKRR